MGTQSESFIDLTDRIGRQTGGLSFYPFISSRRGSSEPLAYLMVRGKAMAEKAPELLDVMRDILLTARLDDKSRFKQVRFVCSNISQLYCVHRWPPPLLCRTIHPWAIPELVPIDLSSLLRSSEGCCIALCPCNLAAALHIFKPPPMGRVCFLRPRVKQQEARALSRHFLEQQCLKSHSARHCICPNLD